MIHSQFDGKIGKKEFQLFTNQEHLEKVWGIMLPVVQSYIDDYLEGVAHSFDQTIPSNGYSAFLDALIKKNTKLHDKYHKLFAIDLMEEYGEDTDQFKNTILKKECDVILHTLKSRSATLAEWKAKFYACESQSLYDSFCNMMFFAQDYDEEMDEGTITNLNEIEGSGLNKMGEESCYLPGVLGFGIVSNVLNHMYPRVFPGNYKAGIYSLNFLTGTEGQRGIDMPSETSEFCMVKDDVESKTGIIEIEHNYYYPYETFHVYTLRIFRELTDRIHDRFQMGFPVGYRFLLTNDFYDYITMIHEEDIKTLTGNDDMLKFYTIWGAR